MSYMRPALDLAALIGARIEPRPTLRSMVLASARAADLLPNRPANPATDVGRLLARMPLDEAERYVSAMASHLSAIRHEEGGS